MRIGINARMLGKKNLEGVGRYTSELVKHLSREHPNDEFILYVDQNQIDTSEYGKNVSCHKLIIPPRHPFLWNLWFNYLLPWAAQRDEIEVFFSPEGMLGTHMKIPTVMTTHDVVFERYPEFVKPSHASYMRKHSTTSHQAASHIIAISQYTKDEIIDLYDIDTDKISVIYNGCSADFYPLDQKSVDRFKSEYRMDYEYFLYLGSLHPRKNIVRLIEAFETFKSNADQHLKLVLAGRLAWLSGPIQAKLNNSPYADDIVHLDYFEGDLNGLINSAKALIYPSLYEGFGLPVLEAMATGTPVVTSANTAMSEVAQDTVLYVDPREVHTIALALSQSSSGDEAIDSLAKAAMVRSQQFDWRDTSELTYQCFLKVMDTDQSNK